MSIDSKFWDGRRVFLTGHTGFKGGWLSIWLHHMGAKVTGYALAPNTEKNLFEIAQVKEGITSVIGDIRDAANLEQAIEAADPEIVIHMAAQPLVRESYKNPVETYSTNVMGLLQVYEACRKLSNLRAIVNVTSDKCYENNEWVWSYRENDPMGGFDPYSNSKGCAELVTSAYRRSFFEGMGIHIASGRAGNVIGGGDWSADRLVPDALNAFANGRPLIVRNPKAERPWQHVLEPLSGYLALAQRLFTDGNAFASGWNFGPAVDQAWPVSRIADTLTSLWQGGASWELSTEKGPHEAHLLALDSTKAYRDLGWTPTWDIQTSLQKTVQWYEAYLNGDNMRLTCQAQIAAFCKVP